MTPAAEAFRPLRESLEAADVPYAITGSWASGAFGEPRMTNDIDVVVDFTLAKLERFLAALPKTYYVDGAEARASIREGRSFNAYYLPKAFKVDFFPARASLLGPNQLKRAVKLASMEISDAPVPFVSGEDILLAKLHWYKLGGGVSEQQWRDICGIVSARRGKLDLDYLAANAPILGVADLLHKALSER